MAYLITVNVYILCSYLMRLFNKGVQILEACSLGKWTGQFAAGSACFAMHVVPSNAFCFGLAISWQCHF